MFPCHNMTPFQSIYFDDAPREGRIVDIFEAADVEEQHLEVRPRVVLVAVDQLAKNVAEVLAVREPRQRVVKCGVLEIFFALAQGLVREFLFRQRFAQLVGVAAGPTR